MKDHTRLLLEKADHAIRAAKILGEADEIEFATGRLYYSMLYVAEALLYERDLVFRKHSAIHAAYGKEFAKTGLLDPKFHRWLLTAFDARIQGDYHVAPHLTDEDVETGLARAREFLSAARRFLADTDSSSATHR
jgi:uncharacterized protein (UPF0332 family)